MSQLIELEQLTSTNSYLAEKAKLENLSDWTIVRSDFQSAGRGYHKNVWESEKGENLLFSFYLKPVFLNPANQFMLSQAISLGIIDFLGKFGKGFQIKWPNDIFFEKKKIAGILIENAFSGSNFQSSIIGIGLNLNQTDFSGHLPNPVSLRQIIGRKLNVQKEFFDLIECLKIRVKQLEKETVESLTNKYLSHLFLFQKESQYKSAGKQFSGTIVGVDEFGRLQLISSEGDDLLFAFKEIEYLI